MPRAVVLLSGGLDSTTALAVARSRGFACHALTVRYGQLHEVELEAARRVAARARRGRASRRRRRSAPLARVRADHARHRRARRIAPLAEIGAPGDVPATYVPARNTVLLALALAWAETLGARDLFVGVNVLDASGYPDCRPEFVRAFEALAQVATRGGGFRVHAPLIELTKAEIIRLGRELGVDYAITHTCYDPQSASARAAAATRARCAARASPKPASPIRRATLVDIVVRVKLGTLLLRNAAIGLSQLEAALRNQVLYGGRLGTNLVELGFLDLELLSTVPRRAHRAADRDADACSTTPTARCSTSSAPTTRTACARSRSTASSRSEAVARRDGRPRPIARAIEELATRLGATDHAVRRPRAARALLPREALRHAAARALHPRPARPAATPASARPRDERRRAQPAGGIAMPPTFTLEPRRRRATSQPPLAPPRCRPRSRTARRASASTPRATASRSRDAFVDYAQGRCDALVVFLIRDGNALGWRGYVAPPPPTRAGRGAVAAARRRVRRCRPRTTPPRPFVGAPPSAARPVESQLWAALGADPAPVEVVVVPILVKQRAVNLVYAHTLGA